MLRFLAQRWSYGKENEKGVVSVSEASKVGTETKARRDEDLSQLVEALKEAVMELRETITELTNPLNRLSYSGDSAEGTSNYRAKVEAIPLSSPTERRGEEDTVPSSIGRELISETTASKSSATSSEDRGNLESLVGYVSSRATQSVPNAENRLRRIMRLMRVVFNLRGRVSPELLERYIEIFVGLRLITREDADLVKNVLRAINEGYASGLGPDEQILLMTILAKGLGINDEALEEEALRVIAENLVRRTPSRGGDGPRGHQGEPSINKAG